MVTTAAPANVSRLESLRRTNTPTRMRIAAAVTAVLAIVVALVGSATLAARGTSFRDARAAAAQLGRIEAIRTNIVRADSLASAGYLAAGLEDPAERARYDATIAEAQAGIVSAAGDADASEAKILGEVATDLTTYDALVAQARANNRQGFPVGAAYQREASNLVRESILPKLDALTVSGGKRTASAVHDDTAAQVGLWLPAIAFFAAAGVGLVWLYRRTHRIVNVGVAVGAIAVFIGLVFGVSALNSSSIQGQDVLDGSYTAASWLAIARTAGFDAKSSENLTLIARGNGAAFEDRWKAQATSAADALARATELHRGDGVASAKQPLDAYLARHATIRSLDDGGQYDLAVKLATDLTVDQNGAPTTDDFTAFADRAEAGLKAAEADASDRLDSAAARLDGARWMVLACGLLAAAAVVIGYGRRTREYR